MARLLIAVLALVAAGVTLLLNWPSTAVVVPAPAAPVQAVTTPAPLPVPAAAPLPAVSALTAVPLAPLAGTEVDGQLRTDADGNLLINLGVRDYFDYFLSAADQAGLDASLGALLADVRGRLAEPARSQLVDLLGDYLEYKRASLALMQQPLAPSQQQPQGQLAALQDAFDRLAQLRRTHFSAAAVEGLFGAEEAYARYTLDTLSLNARTDLSDADKARAQAQAREQLPAALQASELRQQQALVQQAEEARLWRDGADEQQVRAFLALTYDPPTVERLLAEQRSERLWQTRYSAYREAVAGLRSAGLSTVDQQAEQARLRQRLFTAEDYHRVETYDAIASHLEQPSP